MSNSPSRRPPSATRVQKASAQRSKPPIAIIAAVVAVIVFAVVLAVALSGGDDGDVATGDGSGAVAFAHGDVLVEGAPLPPYDAAQPADAAIGATAPELSGMDFTASPVSVEPGEPTVVIFLAHWCPACQAEVPVIQRWIDDNGMPSDVRLVSVATANDPSGDNFPPSSWLDGEGWEPPILVDDENSSAGSVFGLTGFPYLVAIDAEGQVTARHSGQMSTQQFEAFIDTAR